MSSYLRPDEQASEAGIERSKRTESNLKKGAGTLLGIGASAIGAGIASKILPFLSEYIPMDIAVKGISKISPKIGEMLNKGQQMGLDIHEGLDFIKSKMNEKQENKEPAKQNLSIIQQYAPHLHDYISDLIKQGNTPTQAAVKSRKFLDEKHQKIISQIEKDHKSDWNSIVESVFGGSEIGLPKQQELQSSPQQTSETNSQQQSSGDDALIAALEKILKM